MRFTPLEYILILSTILEFNPIFQAIKSIKNKSTEDVSITTFGLIMFIGALWLYYGISIASIPLIIGNSIKLLASTIVVIVLLKFNKNNRRRKK